MVAQQGGEAVGRALAVGGDDDAVAVGEQLGQAGGRGRTRRRRPGPSRRPRRRACRATPASSRSTRRRRARSSRRSGSACRRGNVLSGSRSHVDASALARSSSSASRSRARSRIRRGSTSTTLALSGSTSVSSVLAVDEPRQPALHAVEQRALGEALPLLAAPRLGGDERGGPVAHVVGRDQLAGREDQRLGEVVGRALVVDAEAGQAVDLVAPQVDADRRVGGRREDVDDGAAAGELAAVLDELLAAVAEARPAGGRARRGRRRRRGGRRSARPSVAPGPSRCSSARTPVTTTAGRRSGSRRRHSTSRRWPIVSTDGLTRSNGSVSQAGNRATWPAGRNWARSSASWPAIVPVGQATTSGRAAGQVGQGGDGDRAGHLDDGQAGVGLAEGAGQPRLVAQQWGEVGQSHGRPGYRRPFCRLLTARSGRGRTTERGVGRRRA